jgi:hypothetical protein
MFTNYKALSLVLVLFLVTACNHSTLNDTGISTPTLIRIPKPEAPVNVKLDVIRIDQDQIILSVFVQPQQDFPNTQIKILLPEEISLVKGNLSWSKDLKANEIFSQTISVVVRRNLTDVTNIRLEAISIHPDWWEGKTDTLFFRQGKNGIIEYSHDYYFGATPPTPGPVIGYPATPGPSLITQTPGLGKTPGVTVTQVPRPTRTLTPTTTSVHTPYP